MSWVFHATDRNESSGPPSSVLLPPPPYDQSFVNKINRNALWIIIILSIIFFVSGLLHLLVRLLIRPPRRDIDDLEDVTVHQGQLQQLFHLHDAGVDQSCIDTLPVFLYRSIIGAKNPFDCAVCLCEFEPQDKLRLLPKCSHAFHLECIDTWLLSHSTCPLCRGSLLTDFPLGNCSPVVLVLESGGESSHNLIHRDFGDSFSARHTKFQDGFVGENPQKLRRDDVPAKEEVKVISVKLGKLKNMNPMGNGGVIGTESARFGEERSITTNKVDSRRCYSMGAFQYVLDEASPLQVPIVSMERKSTAKRTDLPLTTGTRPTESMCDDDLSKNTQSRRGEGLKITEHSQQSSSPMIREVTTESFSVSKIWLRSNKGKPHFVWEGSSRRAFSFRLPLQRADEKRPGESPATEIIFAGGGMNLGAAECAPAICGSCSDQLDCGRQPGLAKKPNTIICKKDNQLDGGKAEHNEAFNPTISCLNSL